MTHPPCKVAFLITGLGTGGAERQLVAFVTRLNRKNFSPVVISMMNRGAFADEIEAARIPVHTLGMQRGKADLAAAWRLVALLKRERPLILVTIMYHANILGRIAARAARVSVTVSSIRNINFGGPARERITRLTNWLADMTVANSITAAERLQRDGVIPGQNLRVIPNGVDVGAFRPPTVADRKHEREKLAIAESDFLWLAVGRFDEQKNYPGLLRAFKTATRERQNTRLAIAGEGPLLPRCREMVRQLGIEERVLFLGVRRDIASLLHAADAFVLASSWEGMPNVLLEASAAALPCVTTSAGGAPEIVINGTTGYVAEPNNEDSLARHMLDIMELGEQTRSQLGAAAREHVVKNYAIDEVTRQWEMLFEELLREKLPRRFAATP